MSPSTALKCALGLLWTLQATASHCANNQEACVADDVVSMLQISSAATQRAPFAQFAQPATSQISVRVPAGAKVGDSIQATSPDGQTLQFTMPAEAKIGDLVPVLYTPLQQPQQAPNPVAALEQPVVMMDSSSTENEFQIAAAKADRDAERTVAMQNAAVKNVMSDYATMAQFGDSDMPQMASYFKAEDSQKQADWETMADVQAAQAEAETANFNAFRRSDALQTAAMAKNAVAEEGADYSMVRANTLAVAGTDAAWKARRNPQQMPANMQQMPANGPVNMQQQQQMPANGQPMTANMEQRQMSSMQPMPSMPAMQQMSMQQSAPVPAEQFAPVQAVVLQSEQEAHTQMMPVQGDALQASTVMAPVKPVAKPQRESALDVKRKTSIEDMQKLAEARSQDSPKWQIEPPHAMQQSILQTGAVVSSKEQSDFMPGFEVKQLDEFAPLPAMSAQPADNLLSAGSTLSASPVQGQVSAELLEDTRKTLTLQKEAANAARAEMDGYQAMFGQETVSPAAFAAAEEKKRKAQWTAVADLEAANAVKQVAFQRSELKAEALKAVAAGKYERAQKGAEFQAISQTLLGGTDIVGYDAAKILGTKPVTAQASMPAVAGPGSMMLQTGLPQPGAVPAAARLPSSYLETKAVEAAAEADARVKKSSSTRTTAALLIPMLIGYMLK